METKTEFQRLVERVLKAVCETEEVAIIFNQSAISEAETDAGKGE